MLLDELLDSLVRQPLLLLVIGIVLLVGFFFPCALPVALMLCISSSKVKNAEYIWFGFAVLTSTLVLAAVSLTDLMLFSQQTRDSLLRGDWWTLIRPWTLVPSIPVAALLCSLILLHIHLKPKISADVRRLGKGKLRKQIKVLSEKALNLRLAKAHSSAVSDGSFLGVSVEKGEPVVLSDQNANLHTLAIGTTGSGKTTTISNIIESAIIRRLPIIIVDGKGDVALMNSVRRFADAHDRKFYGFSMIGPSVKYNPLASGGITSKKDRIIELRTWSEDHYRKIAEGYLQTVFSILQKSDIKIDLSQLAQNLDIGSLRQLAQAKKNKVLADLVYSLADKTGDISSLKAEVENLVNSEIGHLFNCNEGDVLELPKALEENAVIYFCLQPLAFPAYANNLGKLIINDIKALAASQLEKEERETIYTIFDEFSVFAGDQIVNLINQGRSAGIHAILSTQSLSDLSKVGGQAFVGQVINNCNNYLIQRQNNPEDSEILAKVVGTKDSIEYTSQISVKDGTTSQGSVRSVKGYLIHPDDIKRLGMGEGYYINKQQYQVEKLKFRQGLRE